MFHFDFREKKFRTISCFLTSFEFGTSYTYSDLFKVDMLQILILMPHPTDSNEFKLLASSP